MPSPPVRGCRAYSKPSRSVPDSQGAPGVSRWPYRVVIFVKGCGHQQEVVLVSEGDGWYAEIPVLGVAT